MVSSEPVLRRRWREQTRARSSLQWHPRALLLRLPNLTCRLICGAGRQGIQTGTLVQDNWSGTDFHALPRSQNCVIEPRLGWGVIVTAIMSSWYGHPHSRQECMEKDHQCKKLLRSQVAIQSRCFMIITSCCIRAERTITSVQIDYTIIGRYDDHRFTRGRNDLVAAGRRCFHDTSPPAAGIHQAVFVRIVTVFNAIVVIENAIYQVQRAHLGRDCTF